MHFVVVTLAMAVLQAAVVAGVLQGPKCPHVAAPDGRRAWTGPPRHLRARLRLAQCVSRVDRSGWWQCRYVWRHGAHLGRGRGRRLDGADDTPQVERPFPGPAARPDHCRYPWTVPLSGATGNGAGQSLTGNLEDAPSPVEQRARRGATAPV
jgi:hypothetical protein